MFAPEPTELKKKVLSFSGRFREQRLVTLGKWTPEMKRNSDFFKARGICNRREREI